jgi:hypothetical protein
LSAVTSSTQSPDGGEANYNAIGATAAVGNPWRALRSCFLSIDRESSTAMSLRRRTFLAATAATAASFAAPAFATARKASHKELIIGEGPFKYRVNHQWAQLPSQYSWQTTHNVAVDKDQNLYVIHEGDAAKKDHPSIFVFDSQGKFVRAFGEAFQGGGHGLEVRQEGNEQFIYLTAYQMIKSFAKLTLKGEVVWRQQAPMDCGLYNKEEVSDPKNVWGRDRFHPTNYAFLDDGGFLLADGYGAWVIHRFDKDGKWKGFFGGEGDGKGKFNTPHGIWIDRRGDQPRIVICDRAHDTLQLFDIDGNYQETLSGFGLPANIDVQGDYMLVPELKSRISILDKDNKVVAQLGDDIARITGEGGKTIREDPSQWVDGKFVHPHDACFDGAGNIFVAEWVRTGRVTKLEKVD